MKESRWLESDAAPDEVMELLKAARATRGLDRETRERSARRVAQIAALPVAATAMFWIQNAALGAVLGVGVAGTAVLAQGLLTPKPVAQIERVAPAPARPPPGPRFAAPVAPSTPPDDVAPEGSSPKRAPAPAPSASETEAGDALKREVLLLEKARSLVAGRPDQALAVLAEHERSFQRGSLAVEREFLIIDALIRLGRRSEAVARADRLRASDPRSLYDQRIDRILGQP